MVDLGRFRFLRRCFNRHRRLQPLLREINALLTRRDLPTFTGWQMTTWHQLPWIDGWEAFCLAAETVRHFDRTHVDAGETVDALIWRHWNIAFSVHYVIEKSGPEDLLAVECGVGDGLTAHFAATQALVEGADQFELHLYDSWRAMRCEILTDAEQPVTESYGDLSQTRTRLNLAHFSTHLRWHPGFIPATLDETAPESISWLHIDLNSAATTTAVLEFFWPRLQTDGVIVFDDYGWTFFDETRVAVNEFFASRPGTLLPLPTGQAFYFR